MTAYPQRSPGHEHVDDGDRRRGQRRRHAPSTAFEGAAAAASHPLPTRPGLDARCHIHVDVAWEEEQNQVVGATAASEAGRGETRRDESTHTTPPDNRRASVVMLIGPALSR